jgi:hypothetical protein
MTSSAFVQRHVKLPANLIMQTIPLNNERYVTFAFDFHANMKATYNNDSELTFFLHTADQLCRRLSCSKGDLFDNEQHRSLWTLKIFPITNDPTSSFELTWKLLSTNDCLSSELMFVSMKEILQQRDITALIQYRSNLINCT